MDELRFLDHTGDIGFDVRSDTLEGLFRRAALGLYEIMVERVPNAHPAEATRRVAKADNAHPAEAAQAAKADLDHPTELASAGEADAHRAEALQQQLQGEGGAKADQSIDLTESALDLLLRSFLSELLFRFLAHRAILGDFPELRIRDNRIHARGRAARFDPVRDGLRTELKAVTYHQLDVKQDASGWSARVIFDV
jgi:SHS2 domain-containing protein